jgi:hypothetical protein
VAERETYGFDDEFTRQLLENLERLRQLFPNPRPKGEERGPGFYVIREDRAEPFHLEVGTWGGCIDIKLKCDVELAEKVLKLVAEERLKKWGPGGWGWREAKESSGF